MNANNQENLFPQQLPTPLEKKGGGPGRIACVFADYVKASIQLIIWSVLGCVFFAGAYVAVRAIYFAAKFVLRSLGVEGGQ